MRTLISVSDKTNLAQLAAQLPGEIISTGGTAKFLKEQGIKVTEISRFTNFPEILDGRVKTLHPQVHAGILALWDKQKSEIKRHKIKLIDLVVVNLYPFAEKPSIENIDIGGVALIRAAAKNYRYVTVVVDPADYKDVLKKMSSLAFRKRMAAKAFRYTAYYDSLIANYFSQQFNERLVLGYKKLFNLRYGENPHQKAAFYREAKIRETSLAKAKQLQVQGKELSFNNILDADAALDIIKEFAEPTAAIIKHTNPCAVASAKNIEQAFKKAYAADPVSSFGGIIALNRTCSEEVAQKINFFCEIIIAPVFNREALKILQAKKNLRLLEVGEIKKFKSLKDIKKVCGGLLIQESKEQKLRIKAVTQQKPSKRELEDLLFAWRVCKHVKSNAIVIAQNKTTLGTGAGQMSRIMSVKIALAQAGKKAKGAVLASDGFFPFRDSIDLIAPWGIKAIIQPGGSIKDNEVIAACNRHNIAMVFTGQRAFKH